MILQIIMILNEKENGQNRERRERKSRLTFVKKNTPEKIQAEYFRLLFSTHTPPFSQLPVAVLPNAVIGSLFCVHVYSYSHTSFICFNDETIAFGNSIKFNRFIHNKRRKWKKENVFHDCFNKFKCVQLDKFACMFVHGMINNSDPFGPLNLNLISMKISHAGSVIVYFEAKKRRSIYIKHSIY